MTIDVTDRFIVHAGDQYSFTDRIGFELDGPGATLVNNGDISLVDDQSNYAITAISTEADDAIFWNRADGRVTVDGSSAPGPEHYGLIMDGTGDQLKNDGAVVMTGAKWTVGLLANRAGFDFENSGLWELTGTDVATGAYIGNDVQLHNSGRFIVTSTAEYATGLATVGGDGDPGALVNTGLIEARGAIGAVALGLGDCQGPLRVANAGKIIAEASPGEYPTVGIELPGTGVFIDLYNSGLLRADIAMQAFSDGATTVVNTGKIVGDFDSQGASFHITNTGLIRGDLNFGGADDYYNGAHGHLAGVIIGGEAADTLIGGVGNDTIFGDLAMDSTYDGADLLRGGAGNDSLFGGGGADTLVGGAGTDLLSGGSGADVFVYAHLSDSRPHHSDLITDLEAGDLIDLSAIDADATHGGNQAFVRVAAFGHHAGELTLAYDAASDTTWLRADVDGDGRADFAVALAGDQSGFTGLVL